MADKVGEYGYSDDPAHRRAYPDRRCAVATAACRGLVVVHGPAQLCTNHALAWEEADQAAKVERMRAWVRSEREAGKVVAVEPRRTP